MAGLLDFLMGGQQPQTQAPPQDMVQGILSSRFQPQQGTMPNMDTSYGDYSSAIMNSINGKPMGGADVANSRGSDVLKTIATIGALQRTNMMMQGGQTGSLIDRVMREHPEMSVADALSFVKSPGQGNTYTNGQIAPIPGAPQAAGAMAYGKESGQRGAELQTAAPIAQATAEGKQQGENLQSARSNEDIVGMYNKLQEDAKTAPSGALESGAARLSNVMNMPTKGAVAQATFDADLNNLYLATIRSLKGTGRVMEQELIKIGEAAPKSTDSMEVKIAKAQAHMAYYQQRMASLGFDPGTGQQLNQNSIGKQSPPVALTSSGAPDGGTLIGTSGGKKVFQMPDGSHVMEQ